MDALMYYTKLDLMRKFGDSAPCKIALFDTKFPASIVKQHARLTKTAVKDRCKMRFDDSVLQLLRVDPDCEMTYDWIYFPFNIDKYHWVGVCLDIMSATLHVIDCNMSLRSESLMKKDLNPVANVFPYLINAVIGGDSRNLPKPFILSRSKGIPQNPNPRDSAVMTALLIQAHASSGVDGCKEVTPVALHSASKQLAVMAYRAICPV